MNPYIKEFRDDFIQRYAGDNRKLTEEEIKFVRSNSFSPGILKSNGFTYDSQSGTWCKTVPSLMTDEEFKMLLSMLMIKEQRKANRFLKSINSILLFWLIIGLLGLLFVLIKAGASIAVINNIINSLN